MISTVSIYIFSLSTYVTGHVIDINRIMDPMDMSLGELRELVISQGGLVCCSLWGRKESDPTEWLNWRYYIWDERNSSYPLLEMAGGLGNVSAWRKLQIQSLSKDCLMTILRSMMMRDAYPFSTTYCHISWSHSVMKWLNMYWSGLPVSSPGDLPNPGIKPVSHALQADFFTIQPPGKPLNIISFVW